MSVVLKTLIYREIKRFLNVYNQTIVAPIINSFLFFTIFTVVFSRSTGFAVDYKSFIASGVIMMAMLQNSYTNTQSTITTAKVLGFAIDVIIPPIPTQVLVFAFLIGGITRGLLVGLLSFTVLYFFANFMLHNLLLLILYSILACSVFSLIGVIFGALSKNFDSATSFNTYFINPITLLSGTFYSITFLSPFWQKVILFNPVFYLIDGFRYALTGVTEAPFSPIFPLMFCVLTVVILFFVACIAVKEKYLDV